MSIERVFKKYDIRGVVGAYGFDEQFFHKIALILAKKIKNTDDKRVVVGRDCRASSDNLFNALLDGLRKSGIHVIDLGYVPTPVVYFANKFLKVKNALMITASHNPPEYNGLKMIIDDITYAEKEIEALRDEYLSADNFSYEEGGYEVVEILEDYIKEVSKSVKLAKPLSIIVDTANCVPSVVAPALYEKLGCKVKKLNEYIDGRFPSHSPDPSSLANLKEMNDLMSLNDYDVGIGLDGDGDRLGVITKFGFLPADMLLALFTNDVLKKNRGRVVVFDVKTSSLVPQIVKRNGGVSEMCATGHSFIKQKIKEKDAILAGELSGHIFFNDRNWFGFDDGIYAGARFLEIFSKYNIEEIVNGFPKYYATGELKIPVAEDNKDKIMNEITNKSKFLWHNFRISYLDGVRIENSSGWAIIRKSNTSNYLIARAEANSPEALEDIKNKLTKINDIIGMDIGSLEG